MNNNQLGVVVIFLNIIFLLIWLLSDNIQGWIQPNNQIQYQPSNFKVGLHIQKDKKIYFSRNQLIQIQLDALQQTNVTITSDNDVRNVQTQLLYQTPWFQSTEYCVLKKCCARSFLVEKRPEDFTPITVFTPRELAEVVVRGIHRPDYVHFTHDELTTNMLPCLQPGVIIQADGNIVTSFFDMVHEQIPVPYVLITGDTDPSPNITQQIIDAVNEPKFLHWFPHNLPGSYLQSPHPKITPMPIGTSQWLPHRPFLQKILATNHFQNPFGSRKYRESLQGGKVYINFYADLPKNGVIPERYTIREKFCGKNQPEWVVCDRTMKAPIHMHYINEIKSNISFVVAPKGVGLDTYRTWESLALGLIVIVDRSTYSSIYDGLPIIVLPTFNITINEYRKIMDEYTSSDEFLNSNFEAWNQIFVTYWRQQTLEKANRLQEDVYLDPETQSTYYKMWKYGNFTYKGQRV